MRDKQKNLRSKISSLVLCLVIISVFVVFAYYALGSSLGLSLWGDDWQLFYILDKTFGPGNPFPYLSLKGYSEPHGIMKLWLLVIRNFLGYADFGYYFIAMVLRIIAAFAGYLFLSKFTRSKWLGLIGGLFVLVGYTGVDTMNYMVHMTTFFVITFLFLSLYFLTDSYKKGDFAKLVLACLFYSVSLIANPLRSHGLLPFTLVFDLLFGLFVAKASTKRILARQTLILVSTLIVYKLGFFGSTGMSFINIPVIIQMINDGNYTFISAFVTTLGKTFFPDLFFIKVSNVIRVFGNNWFKWVVLSGFLIEASIFWFFSKAIKQGIKSRVTLMGFLFANFLAIFFIFRKFFRGQDLLTALIYTFIGVFVISFLFWGLYSLFKFRGKISAAWVGLITGPFLILSSLVVPLLFTPGRVLESSHRYLTLSLVGVAIAMVSLLKLVEGSYKKITLPITVLLLLLLAINVSADRRFFSILLTTRSPEISSRIWNQFYTFMPKTYPDKLLLFYFDDSENPALASDAFLYGFPPRMGLKYNIPSYPELPAYTNLYGEAVSAVTDGKAFRRLGYPEKRIEVSQVYAFKISESGDILDITNKTRADLAIEAAKYE